MTMLKLAGRAHLRITRHGERTYPEECCGVLLGREEADVRTVDDVVEINNSVDSNRGRRFLIMPDDYREAEETARKRGLELLGFYHSHPDHPAEPSRYDLDHAMPWFSYVITSVERGAATAIRSWVLLDERTGFREEPTEIIENEVIHHHPRQ